MDVRCTHARGALRFAVLAAAITTPVTAVAAAGAPPGRVVFASNQTTAADCETGFPPDEIWVVNGDGSSARRLTPNDGTTSNGAPAWNPAGTRIAFTSNRDGSDQLYVMWSNGSHVQRLTDPHGPVSGGATWSPDGSRIAFVRGGDIWVMNADGTNQVDLTPTPALEGSPAWSPVDEHIAFDRTSTDGVSQIWVMAADGRAQVNVSRGGPGDYEPAWSPDGRRLAFVSNRAIPNETFGPGIWIMSRYGNRAWMAVAPDYQAGSSTPAWAPDGSGFAFGATGFGRGDIVFVGVQRRHTTNDFRIVSSEQFIFAHSPNWTLTGRLSGPSQAVDCPP